VFKTVLAIAAVSFGIGLALTPGTAQATCTNTYSGGGFGRLWDGTDCTGTYYGLTGNQQTNLANVGFNDKTGSVQTPPAEVRVDGWVNTGYSGSQWTLLGFATHGSWLSFADDSAINNKTSSVFMSEYA
jgi:hypothetical protein